MRDTARLVTIQTIIDHHSERVLLTYLELSANSTSSVLAEINATLLTLSVDNAKLKARVMDVEGRNWHNNIRITGLIFLQLLFEVLGADILTFPTEMDRAHRSLAAKPRPSEQPCHYLVCFHHFQTLELLIRAAHRLTGTLSYKSTFINIFEDYCP